MSSLQRCAVKGRQKSGKGPINLSYSLIRNTAFQAIGVRNNVGGKVTRLSAKKTTSFIVASPDVSTSAATNKSMPELLQSDTVVIKRFFTVRALLFAIGMLESPHVLQCFKVEYSGGKYAMAPTATSESDFVTTLMALLKERATSRSSAVIQQYVCNAIDQFLDEKRRVADEAAKEAGFKAQQQEAAVADAKANMASLRDEIERLKASVTQARDSEAKAYSELGLIRQEMDRRSFLIAELEQIGKKDKHDYQREVENKQKCEQQLANLVVKLNAATTELETARTQLAALSEKAERQAAEIKAAEIKKESIIQSTALSQQQAAEAHQLSDAYRGVLAESQYESYKTIKELGSGATGTTYLAETDDKSLPGRCILKVQDIVHRKANIEQEIKIMQALIADCNRFFSCLHWVYRGDKEITICSKPVADSVLDLFDYKTRKNWDFNQLFPGDSMTKLKLRLIQGVATLHALNIVHMDLKIENILAVLRNGIIDEKQENNVRIIDFGMSRFTGAKESDNVVKLYGIGTTSVAPPEYYMKRGIWADHMYGNFNKSTADQREFAWRAADWWMIGMAFFLLYLSQVNKNMDPLYIFYNYGEKGGTAWYKILEELGAETNQHPFEALAALEGEPLDEFVTKARIRIDLRDPMLPWVIPLWADVCKCIYQNQENRKYVSALLEFDPKKRMSSVAELLVAEGIVGGKRKKSARKRSKSRSSSA